MGIESWSTEKRLFIFLIITAGFLFLYGYIVSKFQPPPETPQNISPSEVTSPKKENPEQPVTSMQGESAPSPATELPSLWEPTYEKKERVLNLITDVFAITWSNKGGTPISWRLRKYKDREGQPLEMVPQDFPNLYPLQIVEESLNGDTRIIDTGLYTFNLNRFSKEKYRLEMTYADDKLRIYKVFTFFHNKYDLEFSIAFQLREKTNKSYYLVWGPGLENTTEKERKLMGWSFKPVQGIYFIDKTKNVGKKRETHEILKGIGASWAGVHSNFFIAAFLAPEGRPFENLLYSVKILENSGKDHTISENEWEKSLPNLMVASIALQPGTTNEGRLYVGPKDPAVLASTTSTLEKSIQYGFFGFFSKALLVLLNWCYNKIIPNYGWAIIFVTILIRILLWPLSHKMFINSERMKNIQPKIKALNEKYKGIPLTDPRRKKMNEELMRIYGEHGVSPLSGCLPMIFQIPILYGFYTLLSVAIELRGAPFMLWIQDLSLPDRYLVTPILMGISMIAQQKLSPTTVDPKQQRIGYIFSIMLTYWFTSAQSGLVLYWLFSNVLSVAQQKFYHTIFLPRLQRSEPQEKKKRRSKQSPAKQSN